MARRDGEGEGANNDGGRAGAGAGGRGGRGEGREGGRGDGGWRHSIAVRRLVQRVGVAGGGVVLSSFTHPSSRYPQPPPCYSSALALADLPPREPPSSCAGPFTLLSPSLPLYPPVCPLARHPSIDFVTNRLHPIPSGLPTSPSRRPSRSPLERYAPMRVCTLIYKCILFIHISRR